MTQNPARLPHEIGRLLAEGQVAEAAARVVEALIAARGNQVTAAKALGVSDRQMRRWIARLDDEGHDVRALAAARIPAKTDAA